MDRRYSFDLYGPADGDGRLLLGLDGNGEARPLLGMFVRNGAASALPRRTDLARAR